MIDAHFFIFYRKYPFKRKLSCRCILNEKIMSRIMSSWSDDFKSIHTAQNECATIFGTQIAVFHFSLMKLGTVSLYDKNIILHAQMCF